MSNVYPAGVTENNAPWNLPEPWEEETCWSCKHFIWISYQVDRDGIHKLANGEEVCVIDYDNGEIYSCDATQPACELWEPWL